MTAAPVGQAGADWCSRGRLEERGVSVGASPLAVHPPDGCGLSQTDLDQLRQAVLPVQDVRVLQRVHQLVGRLALRRPLLDQRLDAQRGQVLQRRGGRVGELSNLPDCCFM